MPVPHRYPRLLSIPLVLAAVAALAACNAAATVPTGDGVSSGSPAVVADRGRPPLPRRTRPWALSTRPRSPPPAR